MASDPVSVCTCAIIILVFTRMATMRNMKTVLIGVAGFLGGAYYERSDIFSSFEVLAKTFPVPYSGEPTPVQNDKSGSYMEVDGRDIYMDVDPTGNRVSEIMRFGFPGLDNIRSRKNFVISYDQRNRVAHWVFEHLTKDGVKYNPKLNRSLSEFFEDKSIHQYFRAKNSDYRRSGFDRGHLAAAANHRNSQEFLDDTFVLSNTAPQVGDGFNRDSWNRLEQYVRSLTKKYTNLYVCTGPLYLPKVEADGKKYVKYQVVGVNNVAVPTHFFKLIVGETSDRYLDLEAYVMPNARIDDSVPLTAFQVPKDTVERAAGLLFFDKIPDNGFRNVNGKRLRG